MFSRYVNNPDDSLKKGVAYKFMGEIQWKIGDLYGAQESLTNAIHTLNPDNEKQQEELGTVYLVLGNVSLDLKQYDEALSFYDKATALFKAPDYISELLNNKATALQKMGRYKEAIALYDSIATSNIAEQALVARIIDNRARTKWLQQSSYIPLPEFRSAMKIRVDSQYNTGLIASYAHLSDYYAKSNPDSALWYANKMRETAKDNQSPDDILEAIDKLIRLNSTRILKEQWYDAFKKLNDSLQLSRDTTRNRFALIRYDVQKSKADNLLLQQHITRQRIMLYGLIGIALAVITGLYSWFRKRRKRIKLESENAIRNAGLKTSQKVHDVVANGLYGIMNELEHRNTIDKEPLLNKIEDLYEKSRNISYEDTAPVNHIAHDEQMHHLLQSFADDQTRVIIVGNQPAFWSRVTAFQKQELQLVLNEIMVNMKKHSHASNVSLVFKQEEENAFIHYKDDGDGFPEDSVFGNGLNNTVSRIKSINGAINFGKSEKGGLSVLISFPLESNSL